MYGCTMDLSKAFDMVDWCELFGTLRERSVEPIFLRLLLYIYRNQMCDVRWNGKHSDKFSVKNGVRQGAVSSPIFFSVYIDSLMKILRESGIGCSISNIYLGCFGYADDLLLLSASRSGLQSMVNICEKFAAQKCLKFSTSNDPEKSKTKCLVFSTRAKDCENVAPIILNGDPLPWVTRAKHLGNILECSNRMKQYCDMK